MEESKQICYLINLIITPAVKHILLNQIYLNLKDMDDTKKLTDFTTVIDTITAIKFNGYTIDAYLKDVLPALAVKVFTLIYNNNNDPERGVANATDVFIPILNTIKLNNLIVIDDESLLVKNFNDYLIPFFINTYKNFINSMRLAIYGYERYLLNTYQLVRIIKMLI